MLSEMNNDNIRLLTMLKQMSDVTMKNLIPCINRTPDFRHFPAGKIVRLSSKISNVQRYGLGASGGSLMIQFARGGIPPFIFARGGNRAL